MRMVLQFGGTQPTCLKWLVEKLATYEEELKFPKLILNNLKWLRYFLFHLLLLFLFIFFGSSSSLCSSIKDSDSFAKDFMEVFGACNAPVQREMLLAIPEIIDDNGKDEEEEMTVLRKFWKLFWKLFLKSIDDYFEEVCLMEWVLRNGFQTIQKPIQKQNNISLNIIFSCVFWMCEVLFDENGRRLTFLNRTQTYSRSITSIDEWWFKFFKCYSWNVLFVEFGSIFVGFNKVFFFFFLFLFFLWIHEDRVVMLLLLLFLMLFLFLLLGFFFAFIIFW